MKRFAVVAIAVVMLIVGSVVPTSPATAAGAGAFDHLGKTFDFKPIAFYQGKDFSLDNWSRTPIKNTSGTSSAYYGVLETTDLTQDGVWGMARFCFADLSSAAGVVGRTGSFIPANGTQEAKVTFEPNDAITGPRFYELGIASFKVWPDGDPDGYSEFKVGAILVPMGIYTLTLGSQELTRKRVLSWERTNTDAASRFKWTTDTISTTAPAVIKGASYLPLRDVGESIFGCEVLWDPDTKTATYAYTSGVSSYRVSFTIDKAEATGVLTDGNGESLTIVEKMDGSAQLIDGKTMVPLRAISKLMKATVEFDSRTKKITITYPEKKTNFTDVNKPYSAPKPAMEMTTMSANQLPTVTDQVQSTSAAAGTLKSFLKDVKFFTAVRTGGKTANVALNFGYPFMQDIQYADAYIIMSPSRSKVYAWDRIHKFLGRIEFGGASRPPVSDPESPWFKKFMVSTPSEPNPYRELFNSVSWPWYDTVYDGCTYDLYMLDASRYFIAIELVDPLTGEKITVTPFTQQQIYNGQTGVYAKDKLGKYIVDMFNLNDWANSRYKVDSRKEFLYDGKEFSIGDTITIDNINLKGVDENTPVEICIGYQKNTKEVIPNTPFIGEWLAGPFTYGTLKAEGFSFTLKQTQLDKFEERLINEYKKGYIESGKKVEDYGPYSSYGYFIVVREVGRKDNKVVSEGFLKFEGAVTYSQYP